MEAGGIAVIGDLQRTLAWERLFLGRPQLDWVRETIRQSLLAHPPRILILNGDLTAWGSSKTHWTHWRSWAEPLFQAGIWILPVMGNHDYFFCRTASIRHMEEAFPGFLPPLWYKVQEGQNALIILDSNRRILSPSDWTDQLDWLKFTLHALELDPSIRWVHVFSHHSPLRFPFLASHRELFEKSSKTSTWISGHEHSETRSLQFGKTWITWGGGGGPLHGRGLKKHGYLRLKAQGGDSKWESVYVDLKPHC